MCPVVSPQFIHQIFHVKVDHVLRDRQFVGDLFVLVTIPKQLRQFSPIIEASKDELGRQEPEVVGGRAAK
jgi:hypothetical protein